MPLICFIDGENAGLTSTYHYHLPSANTSRIVAHLQFVDLLNNYQAIKTKRQELSIASCTDVVILYTWPDHADCEELILLEKTVVKTQSY